MSESTIDLGVITHECICGSNMWKCLVSFEDFKVSAYATTMYCYVCGAKAIAPTEIDDPNYEPGGNVTV